MEGRDRGENNAGEKEECKEQKIQGGILMEGGTTEKGRDREGQRTRGGGRRNQCTGVSWKEGIGKEGGGSQQKRVGGRREKSEVTQTE